MIEARRLTVPAVSWAKHYYYWSSLAVRLHLLEYKSERKGRLFVLRQLSGPDEQTPCWDGGAVDRFVRRLKLGAILAQSISFPIGVCDGECDCVNAVGSYVKWSIFQSGKEVVWCK